MKITDKQKLFNLIELTICSHDDTVFGISEIAAEVEKKYNFCEYKKLLEIVIETFNHWLEIGLIELVSDEKYKLIT